MKIVLINTYEQTGGAAMACKRLMYALRHAGVDATMLVNEKTTKNQDVYAFNNSIWQKRISKFNFVFERFIIYLRNAFSKQNLFAVSIANTGSDISKHPLVKEADVIHLHWINQGFLSLNDLQKLISLGKPVVWTMHDMWPVTGICHHSRDCDHYTRGCGNCFFLKNPSSEDLSARIFNHKKKIYLPDTIHFVTCSDWLKTRAEISLLAQKQSVTSIPNPLDTDYYEPTQTKAVLRTKLNLPVNKKLLLFGAVNASDKRKGIDYLIDSIAIFKEKNPELAEQTELIMFGNMKSEPEKAFLLPVHRVGYITDPAKMSQIYQAADIYITPSLEENLPNTNMEAMACGLPCVGFETGGIPEMIQHQQTGYVAKYKSAVDFADGIQFVLQNSDKDELGAKARQFVVENYKENVVADRYIKLYNHLLNNNSNL